MPVVTETRAQLYAHCPKAYCPGNAQERVAGIIEEVGWTFQENGGDIPGLERSNFSYRFANEGDAECRACHGRRDLADQVRPNYEPIMPIATEPVPVTSEADPIDLREVVRAQGEQIAALTAALQANGNGKTPKRSQRQASEE